MRKFAFKAFFTYFLLDGDEGKHVDWERCVLIFSTGVTIGLVALYVYGKMTSRW